jgi:hypothetical protein
MVDGREITAGSARSRPKQKSPAKAQARRRTITVDFGSKLIRNQQVISSSLIAGSKILSKTLHFSVAQSSTFGLTHYLTH